MALSFRASAHNRNNTTSANPVAILQEAYAVLAGTLGVAIANGFAAGVTLLTGAVLAPVITALMGEGVPVASPAQLAFTFAAGTVLGTVGTALGLLARRLVRR